MRKSLPILREEAAHTEQPSEASAAEAPTVGAKMDVLRERLRESKGASYWRSLEELSGTEAFQDMLRREFPRFAAQWDSGLDRRRFLQVSSASLALAGLTACTKQPIEKLVPYVRQPEELIPGKPLFFATNSTHAGYVTGVLAESHMGRPTKLEGNPEHSASQGSTGLYAQASILDLYDPDRAQALTFKGTTRTWDAFLDSLGGSMLSLQTLEGEGLHILTRTVTSPTAARLLEQIRTEMPKARWHVHEPAGLEMVHKGAELAFGRPLAVRHDLSKADVILAVDSDLLSSGPGSLNRSRDFAAGRKVATREGAEKGMNRLYVVESAPSVTGAAADHRLALSPSQCENFLCALAAKVGAASAPTSAEFGTGDKAEWVDAVAEDLMANRGRSLVAVGDYASTEMHALAHGINQALGNLGTTLLVSEPIEAGTDAENLADLVAAMDSGVVDTLLILGGNPVYEATDDLDVAAALAKVRMVVHLASHLDETSRYCEWIVPEAHELEIWSDGRAYNGAASVGQPLIEPLYAGKSMIEMLAAVLGQGTVPAEDLVKETWQERLADSAQPFESAWRRLLHDGFQPDSEEPPIVQSVDASAVGRAASTLASRQPSGTELVFRPDPTVFDGRYANNGWLQECPKPITKLTWDNAILVSPRTARELGFADLIDNGTVEREGPMVTVTVGERSMDLPLWVTPGHADGCATLHLGYGREHAGRVGDGTGFNANRLRTQEAAWLAPAALQAAQGTYPLASTQTHHSMEGRNLVRVGDLEGYRQFLAEHPEDVAHSGGHDGAHGEGQGAVAGAGHSGNGHGGHGSNGHGGHGHGGHGGHGGAHGGHPPAYPPVEHHGPPTSISMMDGKDFPYDSYAWGMTIDLTSCLGCNACMIACQAENNIAVVGKDQVMMGRELHWMRIDRYFAGESDDSVSAILQQPVVCMQCEEAPCEVVCPVAATVHSDEGLNDMVYNRCVGTRYCSNNCPYKVRRFNFLLYADFKTPSLKMARNPDVTVRSRGVMEKCTYCVQRINHARHEAKVQGRKIREGDIQTACSQVCSTGAITFGDINDPDSQVSEMKRSYLDYQLLAELGTRPRTSYLARVRNPNPRLEPPAAASAEGHA